MLNLLYKDKKSGIVFMSSEDYELLKNTLHECCEHLEYSKMYTDMLKNNETLYEQVGYTLKCINEHTQTSINKIVGILR